MEKLRRITVQVPRELLEKAQAYTGEGVTPTITAGLKHLLSIQAQQALLKLRGKARFSMTWQDMKYDRE